MSGLKSKSVQKAEKQELAVAMSMQNCYWCSCFHPVKLFTVFQVFLGVDLRRLPSVLSGSAFVQALKKTRSKLQAVVDLERERK